MVVSKGSPARALQKQRQELAANHWSECVVPNGGVEGRLELLKGFAAP